MPSRLHGVGRFQALYGVRKLEHPLSFGRLLLHLSRWLGADVAGTVRDSLLDVPGERDGEGGAAGMGCGKGLPAARGDDFQSTSRRAHAALRTRVFKAERGVRFIPIPHGALAIDVDFAEELETIERHWDAIQEIAARQEARLAAQLRSPAVTA